MALTDNLIEYWKLDSTLNGSLGSINLGQTGVSAGYEAGKIGNAMRYNSTSNVFNTIAHTNVLGAGTVNFWFYRIGTGSGTSWRMFAKTQVGVTDVVGILFQNDGKRMNVFMADANVYTASADQFADSTWYMVTLTWNGTNIISYVNGAQVNSTASASTVASNAQPYTIGGWDGNNNQQANGRVDEFGFWSRALTSTEITQLYSGGAGLTYPLIPVSSTTPMMHMMQMAGGIV